MIREPIERRDRGTTTSLPQPNSDLVGSKHSATLLSMTTRVGITRRRAPCTALHFFLNSTSIDKSTSISCDEIVCRVSYRFEIALILIPIVIELLPTQYLRSRYQRPMALCKRIYLNSEVGTCSSIDSMRDVIRRSTSASPCARFFSASNS